MCCWRAASGAWDRQMGPAGCRARRCDRNCFACSLLNRVNFTVTRISPSGGAMIDPCRTALSPMDLQAIATAIRKAFSRDELTRLVRYGFGIELADYFHLAQGYIFILDEFLAWTEREGKTLDLLALGYRGKPGNPALAAVAQKFQIPGSTRLRHFDPAVGTTENPESLEALVARSSRLTDIPE